MLLCNIPQGFGAGCRENACRSVCQQKDFYGMWLGGIYPIIFPWTFQSFSIIFILLVNSFKESLIVSITFHNDVFSTELIVCQCLYLMWCTCAGLLCTCACMWRAETDWCPVSSSVVFNPIFGDSVSYLFTRLAGQRAPMILLPLPPQHWN